MSGGGVVAAGHPQTAAAGAAVLREGGNAVDAALAALGASCAVEPLLTGLGAGGYLLAAGFDPEPVVLDFFVAAPGLGARAPSPGPLVPVDVSFGEATQVFHVGPAAVGTWGVPAGLAAAAARWGSMALADVLAPGIALARDGVALNREQAYVAAILAGILTSTPESAALWAPAGHLLAAGEPFRWPDLAQALERLGAEGAAPFYQGEVGASVVAWLADRGGVLTREDLAAYTAIERPPVQMRYRGRRIATNPPPSAGGVLIAAALGHLERRRADPLALVEVMEAVQAGRTPDFVDGLGQPGFAERFLARQLGSTTHVSVLDADGRACAVTTTNGEGSGVVVPGTGMHPNNVMGEEDLNPLGFHATAPGTRMPSMMAPTVVLAADGSVELALGSAGSNRIRSAILQVIVGVLDDALPVRDAVERPRLHLEDGVLYAEPGIDLAPLAAPDRVLSPFRERNLFFGGVQAVARDPATGESTGAGDPRRGGAAVRA